MGSIITLGIGKLELDWGKNDIFRNHSKLFLPNDVKEIPYYYADNIIEKKEGFSRKLKDVKRRLELLGYPLNRCKALYQSHLASVPDNDIDNTPLTFEEYYEVIISLDVNKINLDDADDYYEFGEFVSLYLFNDPEFNKRLNLKKITSGYLGEIYENIDPYITLRIIIENPNNAEQELMWRYDDIVQGGWIDEDELYTQLDYQDKILIVTEGSTDSFIIKKSFDLLCPDIKDFFYFVDMELSYPFTGTGNLHLFSKGLVSIHIQNNIIIIYDNDLEGIKKYKQTKRLSLPSNMRIIKLPDHDEFYSFPTVGPNGQSTENINGLAVAIECFLDLSYKSETPSCIRWTSYDKNIGKYQGELINKESYTSQFSKIRTAKSGYDTRKLKYLLDHIYGESIRLVSNRA